MTRRFGLFSGLEPSETPVFVDLSGFFRGQLGSSGIPERIGVTHQGAFWSQKSEIDSAIFRDDPPPSGGSVGGIKSRFAELFLQHQ